ncbi:Phage integrase family protein [Burkholderia sp. OK233]|nr:Phage integrase family protein [Burkholderia sp. OK233]
MSGRIVKMGREVWEVEGDELSPGEVILLQWNSILPIGHGTKHDRATLLCSAKQLFIARYGQDNVWRETYSPRTLRVAFNDLKAILRWMASKSIWRFSDMGAGEILEFFSRIRSRSNKKSDHPSRKTVEKWILIFRRMWEIRHKYSQSLKIDVDELADDIFASVKTREGRPWKALDDDVAMSLISGALGWIDEFGEFIVEVVQASWEEGKKELGKSRKVRKVMSKKFYSEISERDEFERLCEKLGYVGQLHKFVSTALSVTEGACAFLLLMLVGFRVSELLALDIDCLTTEPAKDGSSLAYISGIAAKRGAQRRKWVAGDPVPRILQYLEILTSFRKSVAGRSNALFLGRSPGAPLFRHNVRMRRLAKTGLERRIRLFVRSGLVGGMIKAEKFHCHMARKTFAQLAVRRDKSNLEPVSSTGTRISSVHGQALRWERP